MMVVFRFGRLELRPIKPTPAPSLWPARRLPTM
jgi:hypothetical protein